MRTRSQSEGKASGNTCGDMSDSQDVISPTPKVHIFVNNF